MVRPEGMDRILLKFKSNPTIVTALRGELGLLVYFAQRYFSQCRRSAALVGYWIQVLIALLWLLGLCKKLILWKNKSEVRNKSPTLLLLPKQTLGWKKMNRCRLPNAHVCVCVCVKSGFNPSDTFSFDVLLVSGEQHLKRLLCFLLEGNWLAPCLSLPITKMDWDWKRAVIDVKSQWWTKNKWYTLAMPNLKLEMRRQCLKMRTGHCWNSLSRGIVGTQ